MNYKNLVLAGSILLAGCLDNGSSNDGAATPKDGTAPSTQPTLTGKFKDSSTYGLNYSIGDYHSKTNLDGSFSYFTETDIITFSVGGVVLGSAIVGDILTPIDLFEDGSSEDVNVQNIVRFLLALDSDNDPSNGINIAEDVAKEAKDWQQIDFTSHDLESEISNKITKRLSTLSAADAKDHIESTYNCMYSGLWLGEYGESIYDAGKFFHLIDAETGMKNSFSYSTQYPTAKFTNYTGPIDYRNEMVLFSGTSSAGSIFNGQYDSINSASGTWTFNPSDPGTLYLERFNKDSSYNHRFTIILLDNTDTNYTNSTAFYISIDINDEGEYKAGIYTYNEELYDQGTSVLNRISESYLSSGSLDNNNLTLELAGINNSISFTTDTDFSTSTASLLNGSNRTIDTGSVSYCDFK